MCLNGAPFLDGKPTLLGSNDLLLDHRQVGEMHLDGLLGRERLDVFEVNRDLTGDRRQWKEFLEKNRDKELILYCRSGNRSGRAAAILGIEGFKTANAGGFRDWLSAGLPVRKSDQPAR